MRKVKIYPYTDEVGVYWRVVDMITGLDFDKGFESSADAEMYCYDNNLKLCN